jgi:RNA polymerase sigma factor (sigma-70 family)
MANATAESVVRLLKGLVRPPAEAADGVLLELFVRTGDADALGMLVDRHSELVWRVCRRVLNHHDAEDAFQATFLVLARKAGSIAAPQLLANWLYGVASRISIKLRWQSARRAARQQQVVESLPEAGTATAPEPLLQLALDEELSRLPNKYRAPVVLCYLQGLTNEEASERLGCPKGTLQSRLAWARRRLRNRLMRRGIGVSLAAAALSSLEQSSFAAPPATMVTQTTTAALIFSGWKVGPLASMRAVSLARGVFHAMFLQQLRLVGGIMMIGALSAAAGIWMKSAQAAVQEPSDPVQVAAQAPEDSRPPASKPRTHRASDWIHVKEDVTKSFSTGAAPEVLVETFNGPITVTARSEQTVNVRITKQGSAKSEDAAKEALQTIDLAMTKEGDKVRIVAKRKEHAKTESSAGAAAEVQVPAGAVLTLSTSNGPVTLQGGTGKSDVHTSNGRVVVKDHKSDLHLRTSNGGINVSGGAGKLDLHTSNGTIDLDTDQAAVTAHTSNGSVKFHGTLADGAQTFETSNGSIHITLPLLV